MAYALKYESASKIAPINYLENVFSLLSDLLVFSYVFEFTDYTGKADWVTGLFRHRDHLRVHSHPRDN